jgi:hypothetical protein
MGRRRRLGQWRTPTRQPGSGLGAWGSGKHEERLSLAQARRPEPKSDIQ